MPNKEISKDLIEKIAEIGSDAPEKKSSRIQVLITPTMHETLKALSDATGVSVNSIINEAISSYLNQGNKQ